MKDFDKWLTDRIEFLRDVEGDLPLCDRIRNLGKCEGLTMARQYLRANYADEPAKPTKECSHYWVKAMPLDEKNQAYLCLNCDLYKRG